MVLVSTVRKRSTIPAVLLLGLFAFARPGQAQEAAATSTGEEQEIPSIKRPRHMEFDERLIMGQSLKSGALYLFERKDSEIQSMLKIRKDYRQELLAPLEPTP